MIQVRSTRSILPRFARQRFKVRLYLYVLGPVKARTNHKENRLFSAEHLITLPFIPYPGMGVTLESPKHRRESSTLYLRIRCVEWMVQQEEFFCMTDEILSDPCFAERCDVRGCAKTEDHYLEIQKTLEQFGFQLTQNVSKLNRVTKYADGSWIDPEEARKDERLMHYQMREQGGGL